MSIATHDPLALAQQWLEEAAAAGVYNPWAMALATTGAGGRPACRYVLLKSLDTAHGFVVFYTNYESRKAAELDRGGFAAASLYWPHAGRQLRLEGPVLRSPAQESDAYFASRPRESQLNAWASAQSRPLPPDGLEPVMSGLESRFPDTGSVPRPPGWGGYRLWLDAIEFWIEGRARFHQRDRFARDLRRHDETGFAGTSWTHARLQP